MFPLPSTRAFSTTAALAAVLLLAGCGGASESGTEQAGISESPHEHEPAQTMSNTDASVALSNLPAQAPVAVAAATPRQLNLPDASTLPATEAIKLGPSYTPLIQGTINATPNWPVWYGPGGKPVDGVNCLVSGKVHLHSLISIYKDGKRQAFTDGIGRVHAGCYHAYELHVHDVTGIIHMETDVAKKFKLGQWFSLWGQSLSRDGAAGLTGPVRFYVIEKDTITRYDGNPADIELGPHREILIVSGTTMSIVPKYQWPSGL